MAPTALINAGPASVEVDAVDEVAELALLITIEMTAGGVVRARAKVINNGVDPYAVNDCVIAFPLPQSAREILDFAGHWCKERVPQRQPLGVGTHLRRAGKAAPVRTRQPCCMSVCPDSRSPTGRSGLCTPPGAATTRTMRSESSPASKSSVAANCCCPERSGCKLRCLPHSMDLRLVREGPRCRGRPLPSLPPRSRNLIRRPLARSL